MFDNCVELAAEHRRETARRRQAEAFGESSSVVPAK
jgi:hypothetical protein